MHQPLPNKIDYIEMPSSDLPQTRRFFSELFGWSFEDYGPDYIAFDDGRTTGGFFKADAAWRETTACPLVVFYASDLSSTRNNVVRLGGSVTRELCECPGGVRVPVPAPGSGEFAGWCEKA